MSRLLSVVLAGLFLSLAFGSEWAYNRYGDGWSYEVLAGSNITGESSGPGYTDTANMFISQATGNVSDIYISMATNGGPNLFEISLMTDDNVYPGAVLQTWTVADLGTPFDGIWHEPIHLEVDGPWLEAGTSYWIACHAGAPNGFHVWHFTSPWIFETVGQRFSPGGDWNILQQGFTSAYAIAVVPEPAAAALLLGGLFAALRRR